MRLFFIIFKHCGLHGFLLQDDLGTLSDAKTFGEVVVGLYNEDILPDYTIRTMKVFLILANLDM